MEVDKEPTVVVKGGLMLQHYFMPDLEFQISKKGNQL